VERFVEENALDYAIYNHCRDRFREQLAKHGACV